MLPRLLLLVAVSATVLGGCVYRDPQVHGPFLIGAERIPAGGPDCRPGDVRSQDARNGHIERCAEASAPVAVVAPQAPPIIRVLPAAPSISSGRSAWQ